VHPPDFGWKVTQPMMAFCEQGNGVNVSEFECILKLAF